jgi:hypothetical protein
MSWLPDTNAGDEKEVKAFLKYLRKSTGAVVSGIFSKEVGKSTAEFAIAFIRTLEKAGFSREEALRILGSLPTLKMDKLGKALVGGKEKDEE